MPAYNNRDQSKKHHLQDNKHSKGNFDKWQISNRTSKKKFLTDQWRGKWEITCWGKSFHIIMLWYSWCYQEIKKKHGYLCGCLSPIAPMRNLWRQERRIWILILRIEGVTAEKSATCTVTLTAGGISTVSSFHWEPCKRVNVYLQITIY